MPEAHDEKLNGAVLLAQLRQVLKEANHPSLREFDNVRDRLFFLERGGVEITKWINNHIGTDINAATTPAEDFARIVAEHLNVDYDTLPITYLMHNGHDDDN